MLDETPNYEVCELGEAALLFWFRGGRAGESIPYLHRLAELLRDRLRDAVLEVVPAATSLLIAYDPQKLDAPAIRAELDRALPGLESAPPSPGKTHVIPIVYGGEYGPDLAAVAARHRVGEAALIRAHTAQEYIVGFLGFLPGFAYMGPLPLGLATSRLATPRVRVPGGSVALAGRYTGVYPFASPGGWNLIGRTDTSIWDPYSPSPALFMPGDRVRLVQSESIGDPSRPPPPWPEPRYPLFAVEAPGALSLIQDKGRVGYAHLGLGAGGVSDGLSAARANALLGNPPGAPVLEMSFSGPTLRVLRSTLITLEGADLGCRVDSQAVPAGVSWFVRAGSLIAFIQTSPSESGARAFLAVPGGFDVPAVLDSRSTCLVGGFGGYAGRPLRAGDVLGAPREVETGSLLAGKFWLPRVDLRLRGRATLRVIRYSGRAGVAQRAFGAFLSKTWLVSKDADRVGVRLLPEDGSPLPGKRRGVPSFGVVRGTIQLPPGGNPLVLGVDAGTTGGYPILGVVAQADWPSLAQLRPGDRVGFAEIAPDEARWERQGQLSGLKQGIARL